MIIKSFSDYVNIFNILLNSLHLINIELHFFNNIDLCSQRSKLRDRLNSCALETKFVNVKKLGVTVDHLVTNFF